MDSETSLKTQDACSTDSGKCSWITEGQLCTFSPLLTSSPCPSLQSQQAPVRASRIWPTNLLLLHSSQHQQPQGSQPAITLPPKGRGTGGHSLHHWDQRQAEGAWIILRKQIPSVHWLEIGQRCTQFTGNDVHCSYLHQLSRGQGQVSSAPAALLKPEESKKIQTAAAGL